MKLVRTKVVRNKDGSEYVYNPYTGLCYDFSNRSLGRLADRVRNVLGGEFAFMGSYLYRRHPKLKGRRIIVDVLI